MTTDVLGKYLQKSRDLAMNFKTGYECSYCGNPKSQTNRYGTFCAGCGAERMPVIAKVFGVPVFDPNDAYALMRELEYTGIFLPETRSYDKESE